MIRRLKSAAIFTAGLAWVLVEEAASRVQARAVGWLFVAPEIRETGNPGFQVDPDEVVTEPSLEELNELRVSRLEMVPPARKREPEEDSRSNEVLVGSLEWRRQQQGRASR